MPSDSFLALQEVPLKTLPRIHDEIPVHALCIKKKHRFLSECQFEDSEWFTIFGVFRSIKLEAGELEAND